MTTRALVILSGGQDSTTCLYWAKQHFDEVGAITFDYGQRHMREVDAAIRIADMAGVCSHEICQLGDSVLAGASPLTNLSAPLEQYDSYEQMDAVIGDRVELTFVPMRNALFLTVGANRAVAGGYGALVTGVCESDNANYPDCRVSFINAMQAMVDAALGKPVFSIATPLIDLDKAAICRMGRELPGCWDALAYSHTAYDGSYPPTGRDHATVLRAEGFRRAGLADPLVVRAASAGAMPWPETENYDALAGRRAA